MTTTIAAGFDKLKSNLEITALQSATVSTRQLLLRETIEKDLDVLSSYQGGSYARSTMIAPLSESDVDIYIVLDPKYYAQYKPAALLDRLRTILLKTYKTTRNISRNGQAVTVSFTECTVDVVPCFCRTGGGYLIPNSITGKWIETDPTVHGTKLTEANEAHNGDLVPLIKMIKGWNRNINEAFVGFYLELMTIDILTNVTISSFSSGARFVFDKGREKIKFKQRDTAGFGDNINPLDGVKTVEDAVSRFATAYNRAVKAEEFATLNKISDAHEEWRKIFGNNFPAYG
jgi:Second Messenger Oligonucleotide or Dinucleotide Synthetase domain